MSSRWDSNLRKSVGITSPAPYRLSYDAKKPSDRVLDSRPKGRGIEPHRRHCVVSLSRHITHSLVLAQPKKTCLYITEILLMGRNNINSSKVHTTSI